MASVASSLLLALGQLADARVMRVLVKSLVVSLVLFAAAAVGGWFALDWTMAAFGLGDAAFTGAEQLRAAASLLLTALGLWFAWRVVAMAVIGFFADDVVLAVEVRHYPQAAATARDLSIGEQFVTSLTSASRAVLINLLALPFALFLLLTGVGTALLFLAVNAVLIGKELEEMVWLRHRGDPRHRSPLSRPERLLLGAAVAGLLAVPIVNLLAPLVGAAAATHLVHRSTRR